MWLRSVFLKTLRDCRLPVLGWGLGLGVFPPIIFAAVATLLNSPVAREEILALTRNPVVRVFAEPVDVLSPGGYATWRLSMVLPILGVWALLAVSRVTRGEEESSALDLLLSVDGSRLRVVSQELAAIAAALALIGLLIALLALAGARGLGVPLTGWRALFFGLNTALFAAVFGALAFFISQFTRERRPAAGIAGVLLGLSFVLTSVSRVVQDGEWIGWLSPLYYFELNKPLVIGYAINAKAFAVMTSIALALTALGLALFARRDIGAACISLERYVPARRTVSALPLRAWSLRSLLSRSVRLVAVPATWWGIGLGTYALLLTMLLRQIQQNVTELLADMARNNPMYAAFIDRFTRGGDVTTNMMLLNAVYTVLVVVVAAFAVSLASRWASDEEDGRLDLVLATPNRRARVMIARFAAAALAIATVAGFIFSGTALAAAMVDMELDTARVGEAALGMLPVGLIVASAGYLLSGWLRTRAVTGILIALVLGSFLLTLMAPLLHWPPAIMQLSIVEQYGSPLVDGLHRSRLLGQLAFAAAALTIAVLRFEAKDVTG